MGLTGTSSPYLRFGLLSAIVIAMIAAAFSFVATRQQAHSRDDAAAHAAAALVAAPLIARFDDVDPGEPIPQDLRANADVLMLALGLGDVRALRVTNDAGRVMYQAGVPLPAAAPSDAAGGIAHTRTTLDDGTALFVTRSAADGFVVEVAQEAAATGAATGASFYMTVAGFALLAFLLLQGAFWWAIRSFARAHGNLSYLYDTGQELRSSLDLHDVLSRLATDSTTLVNAQYAIIGLFDEESSEVMLRAAYDGPQKQVSLHQKAIDDWFVRRCVATNTSIKSDQVSGSFRTFFGTDAAIQKGWVLCVPMAIRDRVVGAIAVLRTAPGYASYTAEEQALVEQMGMQAVTAVEQAILFAKVRADAEQLESSYDSTLKALMAALDAKDEVTEGHCERVAKITTELARMMGVPESMMVHIERGALLHDVGKIGVPDGILKKPRALTDSEWEAMRKHPLLAGLMVSKVGFLEPAMPILLYHHEKYDGTGYPFGLAGANIPVEARIFSVIDAYDAMTSDRPYRPAMTHADAMDEVRANNGTQFDPQVVAAFEQLMATRRDLREPGGRRVLGMHDLEGLEPPDQHVA